MKSEGKILLLGASDNPNRISYMATKLLIQNGFNVHAVSHTKKHTDVVDIYDISEPVRDVRTISIFLSPEKQRKYYDYILSLNPKRVIFNPGTENKELIGLLLKKKISVVSGCTIALLTQSLL